MNKIKMNWKNAATAVACLAVCSVFISCKKKCDPATAKPGDECYVEQSDPYAADKAACAAKQHPDSTYVWNSVTNHCDATFTGLPIEQRDTVLYFWYANDGLDVITDTLTLKSIAMNSQIRYIYLSPRDEEVFAFYPDTWPLFISKLLVPAINTSKKVTGKGNIVTMVPGTMSATDSLWFVANGWTVNQK